MSPVAVRHTSHSRLTATGRSETDCHASKLAACALLRGSPAAPIWALPSLDRLTRVALQSPDGRPRDDVHV
jgi:hypothetical protein